MSNSYFRFKQFTVWHDQCAMKVGTDGVLLGSWVDVSGCCSLLDVGLGSGLIALMLAQRAPCAMVDGVDIDPDACRQARENVAQSPFADRIRVMHASFGDYVTQQRATYDLVVSNPPFYANSLNSPDKKRALARQGDATFLPELLDGSRKLLTPRGRIALILPFARRAELVALLEERSLSIVRETAVIPVAGRAANRLLLEVAAWHVAESKSDQLVLKDAHLLSTVASRTLTADFYL